MQRPDNTVKRLCKVIVRTIHLVGMAGVFGGAMMHASVSLYLYLTIASGVVLVLMEASSGMIWCVQLRGCAVFIKLLLLLIVHLRPEFTIPCLIAVIVISGLLSHAPSWIRYFSLWHGRVVLSEDELLG